ncbi:small ribosomal subunit protein uS15m [Tiliqua scincoides]|uniref:small ribosomal subunit protein uS15m n=1 Tax=Tiliqua scincoides TaxID=71010 RepID=UPI003461FA6A
MPRDWETVRGGGLLLVKTRGGADRYPRRSSNEALPGTGRNGCAQELREEQGAEQRMLRSAWAAALRSCSRLSLRGATARGVQSKSSFLQPARDYARIARKKKQEIPSHLDDLPPTMLKKDYAKLPVVDKVDDVVRRLLSLEMASQKEKVKIKREQLADKVRKATNDNGSFEVQVAYLTAKIQTLQEHFHQHPKDKSNRRRLLMAIDRRKKLLVYLRNRRYDVFENTCKQLGIEYAPTPQYRRKPTRRSLAKKALVKRAYEEVRKLKAPERLKQRREWQERARAARAQALQNSEGTPV